MAKREPEDLREFSLRDVLYVLFRHKGKALLLFLVVAIRAGTMAVLAEPAFESEAKLMVRLGRETVNLDPTASTAKTMHVSRSLASEINSELEILRSRDLLERVVDAIGPRAILQMPEEEEGQDQEASAFSIGGLLERLGLRKPLPLREQVIGLLEQNLDIGVQKGSNIIRVGYEAGSPDLAKLVVDVLVQKFLEKHIEVHQASGAYDFFAEQTEHFRTKLDLAERTLSDLRRETGIVSVEEQNVLALRRIADLETLVATSEAEIAYSESRALALRASLDELPDTLVLQEAAGLPNANAETLRARLHEFLLSERDIAEKYVGGNPLLESIRAQVAEAEALLANEDPYRSEITSGPNANKQQLIVMALTEEMGLVFLASRLREQRRQLEKAYESQTRMNQEAFRVGRLTRDIERDEMSFEKYSENLEQARIYDALESSKISNIGMVQEASRSDLPVSPSRLRTLALGLFVGLFGALGVAFAAEFLDQTVKTPDEAEDKLQLSTLASVPRSRHHRVRAPGRWSRGQMHPDAQASSSQWYIPYAVFDQFKNLRTQLFDPGLAEPVRVIAITGCYSGSGTTTVAANLAASMAQADLGEVLLVDANIGAPSVHELFKAELSPGLADLLANYQRDTQTIQPSPVPNLEILSAGVADGQRGVNDTEQFAELFEVVKARYRVVIVDLPAINENVIATRLAGLCDGVIIVIEAEALRWQVIDRAKRELARSNANVLGAVLNKRRYPIPDWLYRLL